MGRNKIVIKGAREHNLKNISLSLPRNKLIVITGLSGSGKSSLAFDTIYAESQRRYLESLSSYARQFLERIDKPDVDYIEGLSPSISIDQRKASKNPRSTVGTVTEIYDYLRLLYARIGIPHCPGCGRRITKQSIDQIIDQIMNFPYNTRIKILSPIIRSKKGEHKQIIDDIRKKGFIRLRIDGKMVDVDDDFNLARYQMHTIDVVVDRLIIKPEIKSRLSNSVETALHLSDGLVIILDEQDREYIFSEKFSCPYCGISLPEITPRIFSFNSPYGACPNCSGLGFKMEFDPDLVVPDKEKSILDGALVPWGFIKGRYLYHILLGVAKHYGFKLSTPFHKLTEEQQKVLLYGSGNTKISFEYHDLEEGNSWIHQNEFEGVINNLKRRYRETKSEYIRSEIQKFMTMNNCLVCKGKRLRPESLMVKIADYSIADLADMTVKELVYFFENLNLLEREAEISRQIRKEILNRLKFLMNVGLDYITLSRSSSTLAGGENQRIRLATQIGSSLTGVLYILDEPSIGLHQRDNSKLLKTLLQLRDQGNTVIVIEHDEETIRAADFIVDLGPGAGIHGGYVVAVGKEEHIMANQSSITGQYLSDKCQIPVPLKRRLGNGKSIKIIGARQHNLKNMDVSIPLGKFNCITGVSGSGKSTLIEEILYKALLRELYHSRVRPGDYDRLEGIENIDKVIIIDQSPIGKTSRSNPATYTGIFTPIRELFAKTSAARMRGYLPGRFSFNVKGGRCESCEGAGIVKIEMFFLPDVYIPCEVCKGQRFNRETLEIKYRDKNIAQVLDMTVEECKQFFENIPKIKKGLQTLIDVGLGYIKLGQSATTLSGGEAQRVKLAKELSKKSTGRTLYLLDEPTTGLHFDDVRKLLDVLNRLVDQGNTVLVIEHNMEVIKSADHIIDLGPGGGEEGGKIVFSGTPEEIANHPVSFTGQFLKKVLNETYHKDKLVLQEKGHGHN
ncbi:MAG: excinuclease ABC subunit UvrA [Atribacterota bacterium]|nr:excinuclease ABC subunit UvrA [Atribacterota bacterium]MDD5636344.1 excinuclease ABC subunit UvrA [Atribacterota bacterium]